MWEGLFVLRLALSCPLPLPRVAKARGQSVSINCGGRCPLLCIPACWVDPLLHGIVADPLRSLTQCPLECLVSMLDID
jgi:hypothetical protein